MRALYVVHESTGRSFARQFYSIRFLCYALASPLPCCAAVKISYARVDPGASALIFATKYIGHIKTSRKIIEFGTGLRSQHRGILCGKCEKLPVFNMTFPLVLLNALIEINKNV
jgi:hypothetical protein